MKGKVSTTIPTGRQYENIKTEYFFETDEERNTAFKWAITDCLRLNGEVTRRIESVEEEAKEVKFFAEDVPEQEKSMGVLYRTTVNNIQWRKRQTTGAAWWEYWDVNKSPNQWVSEVHNPELKNPEK